MLKQETTKIGGRTVVVTEFPARFKLVYGAKLMKLLPPLIRNVQKIYKSVEGLVGDEKVLNGLNISDLTVEKLLSTDLDISKLLEVDAGPVADAVEQILDVMTGEEILEFMTKLLEFTYVDNVNASSQFDDVFGQNVWESFSVAVFTIKVNGFFPKGFTGVAPKV